MPSRSKFAIQRGVRPILLAVLVSLGAGIVSYFLISSLMLWTINVADEEGHGPDPGSLEWQNAIAKTTEVRHNRAVTIAAVISILSLPACLSLTRQPTHSTIEPPQE